MHRPSALLGSCFVLLLALNGCSEGLVLPSDGTPAELRLIQGDDQSGAAGAPLADSLEVRVLDARGNPLPRQTVSFRLESALPGAGVSPENSTTRTDGTARAMWVLGATSGIQEVVASVARGAGAEPLEARFSAIVGAAGAQRVAIAAGNEQSGPVGSALANPLVVLVTDGFGNPVAGIAVEWDAQDGSIEPGSSVTGSDGKAQTSWTLGSSAGAQSASASSPDLTGSPVAFTATALPGSPTRLERVSGDDQSAEPGQELSDPLVVRLLDEAGNGVPNRAVSWVVASGGGSVSSATSSTDENGRASTRWTLGASEGVNTLNAVVSGVGVVAFSATAGEDGGGGGSTASRLEFRVQPSDTEEGRRMDPPVEVAVVDQSGNPVTDREFEIKLELLDDDDEVRADGTVTTRSGVATFTIRIDREGEYRLRASTDGLPSVESDRFDVEED